ncbi:S-adenosyl-L-methionine-dependent methyltransferase [Mycena rosella]|uniref:tRNA N(3)-methylcytidine methyltransferase n=1 Tax=Mycena rosella TaxID=1033263 RepID=A0AAD7H014_MYCRO|nr:S-adenosyl-L-methionine-dependent methyltransferase [Mycena rosella]
MKQTSSVHDIAADAPPFGSRFLTDEAQVWTKNAWDHVPPPNHQEEIIAASLLKQRSAPVPDDERAKYNDRPARQWDTFYRLNSSNFFKDRKWLHNEFPELLSAAEPDAGPQTVVEVGCGAGNAVFPLLSANRNPHLVLRAYDYSKNAVKLVQENPLYTSPPAGSIEADVWDLTSDALPDSIAPASADIVIMVFVFSALHPAEWRTAVANVHRILKPGGRVLFRDYGRYDMAQLRFKSNRLLDDNFYLRGDKTRVYFFEMDELALLFTGARAQAAAEPTLVTEVVEDESEDGSSSAPIPASEEIPSPEVATAPEPTLATKIAADESGSTLIPTSEETPPPEATTTTIPALPKIHPSLLASTPPPLFATEQLGIDRRLLLNRKRQLRMYRVWMQAKFRKVDPTSSNPVLDSAGG